MNKSLIRKYNGDFGLLPIEIWEKIYKMRDEMEWNDIKEKVNYHLFTWKINRDYNLIERKSILIDEIKSLERRIRSENQYLDYHKNIEITANNIDDYHIRELNKTIIYYQKKLNKHIIVRDKNSDFVAIPFRFTNGICVIKSIKYEEEQTKLYYENFIECYECGFEIQVDSIEHDNAHLNETEEVVCDDCWSRHY